MKNMLRNLMLTTAVAAASVAGATTTTPLTGDDAIALKLAKEIRTYSRYTIWDNINLRVRDGNVELIGQVSQPFKEKDLERIAQRVPGVNSVTNTLQVLPLSPFDDNLRIRVARAIYRMNWNGQWRFSRRPARA